MTKPEITPVETAFSIKPDGIFARKRDEGAAIIVVSEDIDELYQISDRIGAICDGQLSPVKPTQDVGIETLGQWMAGQFGHDSANPSSLESAHA